jgi:hypothetical protein
MIIGMTRQSLGVALSNPSFVSRLLRRCAPRNDDNARTPGLSKMTTGSFEKALVIFGCRGNSHHPPLFLEALLRAVR